MIFIQTMFRIQLCFAYIRIFNKKSRNYRSIFEIISPSQRLKELNKFPTQEKSQSKMQTQKLIMNKMATHQPNTCTRMYNWFCCGQKNTTNPSEEVHVAIVERAIYTFPEEIQNVSIRNDRNFHASQSNNNPSRKQEENPTVAKNLKKEKDLIVSTLDFGLPFTSRYIQDLPVESYIVKKEKKWHKIQ